MRSLTLLALLLTSPAAFAEWHQFAEQRDNDLSMALYYEPDSLVMGASRFDPNSPHKLKKPKVSVMVIFSRPKPQFSWRASKFLWEANCPSQKIRLLASVDFNQMGQDLAHGVNENYMEWMAAADGGVKNSVYNLLCADLKKDAK
ncbi:MAG: hypothetical protein RI928_1729 [Pseudomonadota bacterium]|jgi:hypothetical protein